MVKLSFDSTVARHLVHRASVAEVLLTDWRQTGSDAFLCAAQWPRGHSLYGVLGGGRFDPLLVGETLRQAGILIAHVGYDVPFDYRMLMRRIRWNCAIEALHDSGRPLECLVEVEVSEVIRRARAVSGMRVDAALYRDGAYLADASGWVRFASPEVYERARWAASPETAPGPPVPVPPADPGSVGRELVRDVVVGPDDGAGTRPLRVLLEHPVLFDHPLDHVPGMYVMEAMRQAAIGATGKAARVVGADAEFPRFLDLDHPCAITAEPAPAGARDDRVALRLVQRGAVAAHGWLRLAC